MFSNKPVVAYWKSSDPCYSLNVLAQKISPFVNVIRTKRLTDEFVNFCITNKKTVFLHIHITGLSQTPFEKNIPTVKETFFQIKKLIDADFPQKQILVVVDPILPNENGLRVLKLILKVFTEFKLLRLRKIRLKLLTFKQLENGNYVPNNDNIIRRKGIEEISPYLFKDEYFIKDYYKLLKEYESIISVDKGDEALIGVRELSSFGYSNEYIDENGVKHKIIEYENGNKYKPILKIISGRVERCSNMCLICPYKDKNKLLNKK